MTDEEHAKAIRDAATALNQTIRAAAKDGLYVSIKLIEYQEVGKRCPVPSVDAYVDRPIEID